MQCSVLCDEHKLCLAGRGQTLTANRRGVISRMMMTLEGKIRAMLTTKVDRSSVSSTVLALPPYQVTLA